MNTIDRALVAIENFLSGDRVDIAFAIDALRRRYSPSVLFSRYSGDSNPILPNSKEYALVSYMDAQATQMVPYTYRCDPKTLFGTVGEPMKIETFRPPYLQPYFQLVECDPLNDTAMMRELQQWIAVGGPAFDTGGRGGIGSTQRTRIANWILMKTDMMEDGISWTIEEQFHQNALWGKCRITGPTIKEEDRIIDPGRDPKLTATIPAAQSWNDTSVDAIGHINHMCYLISRLSMRNANVTARYWSRTAFNAFKKNDFFTALGLRPNGNNNGVANNIRINLTPVAEKEPGLFIADMDLGDGVTDYVYDEYRKVVRYKRDAAGAIIPGETEEVLENVLPEGAVFFIAENDHLPMSIYALVEHLGQLPASGDPLANSTFESLRRFPTRWASPDGKCWNFGLECAPYAGVGRPNTMGILFPLSDKLDDYGPPAGITLTEFDIAA